MKVLYLFVDDNTVDDPTFRNCVIEHLGTSDFEEYHVGIDISDDNLRDNVFRLNVLSNLLKTTHFRRNSFDIIVNEYGPRFIEFREEYAMNIKNLLKRGGKYISTCVASDKEKDNTTFRYKIQEIINSEMKLAISNLRKHGIVKICEQKTEIRCVIDKSKFLKDVNVYQKI